MMCKTGIIVTALIKR
uniref:Uncharacterized protein n=1 Tax=Anguilla anguilla TaxID=7936 RepID=A0A0E9T431_ANGAN